MFKWEFLENDYFVHVHVRPHVYVQSEGIGQRTCPIYC